MENRFEITPKNEESKERVEFIIEDGVLRVTKGVFRKIDLSRPEGIEVTHPDGTVEVLRDVKQIIAEEVGDVYM